MAIGSITAASVVIKTESGNLTFSRIDIAKTDENEDLHKFGKALNSLQDASADKITKKFTRQVA